jgi:hypothetical protein
MCGIFGLYSYRAPKTRRAALNTLLNGLRQLEYRGCAIYILCGAAPFALLLPLLLSFTRYFPGPAAYYSKSTPQAAVSRTKFTWFTTCCRYDSAGVCIDGTDKRLVIAKATGKVDILAELANARVNDDITCPGDEVLLSDILVPLPYTKP